MRKTHKLIAIVIGILFVIGLLTWGLMPYFYSEWNYPVNGHMIGGWGMPLGMIGMVLFWAFVIYLVIYALDVPKNNQRNTALEVLKARLAKGDITIEEYEALVRKIEE